MTTPTSNDNGLPGMAAFLTHIRQWESHLVANAGVTLGQAQALLFIHQRERANMRVAMKDVSQELRVTPAVVTGIVDRLERLGLVRRITSTSGEGSTDRRRTLLAVTDAGRAKIDELGSLPAPEAA